MKPVQSPPQPLVAVIMGSTSDWSVMSQACAILTELSIPYEAKVVSAHRTPQLMQQYALACEDRRIQVIIAGAGGAAHLPGMVAALSCLPVIGVPISLKQLSGMDSLLSIVSMPKGVPVATMAIDGATNAGILAGRILALAHPQIKAAMDALACQWSQPKNLDEFLASQDEDPPPA